MSQKKVFIRLPTPTETQMKSVVRGDDRYHSRDPKLGMLVGALLMLVIFIIGIVYALSDGVSK